MHVEDALDSLSPRTISPQRVSKTTMTATERPSELGATSPEGPQDKPESSGTPQAEADRQADGRSDRYEDHQTDSCDSDSFVSRQPGNDQPRGQGRRRRRRRGRRHPRTSPGMAPTQADSVPGGDENDQTRPAHVPLGDTSPVSDHAPSSQPRRGNPTTQAEEAGREEDDVGRRQPEGETDTTKLHFPFEEDDCLGRYPSRPPWPSVNLGLLLAGQPIERKKLR